MSTKTTKQTVDQLKTAKKYLSAVDGRAHYLPGVKELELYQVGTKL